MCVTGDISLNMKPSLTVLIWPFTFIQCQTLKIHIPYIIIFDERPRVRRIHETLV